MPVEVPKDTEIVIAAADAVHSDPQLKPVGDVYVVPAGARLVFFVIDRSALTNDEIKNILDQQVLRSVIEQSIDGARTFGNEAEGQPGYSLRDEATYNAGVMGPKGTADENSVRDAWDVAELHPRTTHVRFSLQAKELVKCGVKVAFK